MIIVSELRFSNMYRNAKKLNHKSSKLALNFMNDSSKTLYNQNYNAPCMAMHGTVVAKRS